MMIMGCAVVGAIGLGAAGFAFGARIPDERAGEIASLLGWSGLAAGAVLGALAGALLAD